MTKAELERLQALEYAYALAQSAEDYRQLLLVLPDDGVKR